MLICAHLHRRIGRSLRLGAGWKGEFGEESVWREGDFGKRLCGEVRGVAEDDGLDGGVRGLRPVGG